MAFDGRVGGDGAVDTVPRLGQWNASRVVDLSINRLLHCTTPAILPDSEIGENKKMRPDRHDGAVAVRNRTPGG